ncbi:NAD(P)-binding domain-containing protein [Microbacterium sp. ARD32]|uniref:NADPH-dependent F420 reductase n=1 Tax=Microbacterium sp. ARD32 TaxID=2962577 RepID=UPI002881099E|nr:NAD(P)-binding domain-containing protein [Microbacterium sp. ARD32]MDT0157673.1 NAD(P)-binding domain-containing protein [Microbacterium sp. ARD32]
MTSISIIGSGKMSGAIAEVATRAGAGIQIIKRSATSTSAARPGLEYGVMGDELTGDLVVLAVPYGAYEGILEHYRDQLSEKVVIDISNPIDFSTYDRLRSPADSSTAAELAKLLPEGAAVVKAFNVNLGDTLVSGTNGTTRTTVLYAGDYADAKMSVAALIEGAGMRAVDVGPLTRARELEAMGFLQIIMAALGRTRYESGFTLLE